MATRVSKPEPESFDRTPYIFERTRVDDMGESITETFYSVAGRKQEFLFTYPEGRFVTEIVELKSTFVVFRCDVFLNAADERPYRNAYLPLYIGSISDMPPVPCEKTFERIENSSIIR